MIWMQCMEILATFTEAFLGIWMNVKVLGKEKVDWKKLTGMAVVVTTVVWCCNQIQLFSLYTTVVGTLGFAIGAMILGKLPVVDTFVLTGFYIVVMYIIDFTALSVGSLFYKEEQWVALITNVVSLERTYLLCISKLVLIATVYLLVNKGLCKLTFSIRKLWVGVVLGCLTVYFLIKRTFFTVDVDILMIWLLLLVLVILAVYALAQYNNHVREKEQAALLREREAHQLQVYTQLQAEYEQRRGFYHDIKNQHVILQELLQSGDYDKAEQYVRKLQEQEAVGLLQQRTGMQVVDLLLEHKLQEARKAGIEVQTEIEPVNLAVTEQELVSVLGNALDNAIEACQRMTEAHKWLTVKIHRTVGMTQIQIRNAYEQAPKEKHGKLVTTKEDSKLHGLGIGRMECIMEQIGGTFRMEYGEGVFTVTLSFFD